MLLVIHALNSHIVSAAAISRPFEMIPIKPQQLRCPHRTVGDCLNGCVGVLEICHQFFITVIPVALSDTWPFQVTGDFYRIYIPRLFHPMPEASNGFPNVVRSCSVIELGILAVTCLLYDVL